MRKRFGSLALSLVSAVLAVAGALAGNVAAAELFSLSWKPFKWVALALAFIFAGAAVFVSRRADRPNASTSRPGAFSLRILLRKVTNSCRDKLDEAINPPIFIDVALEEQPSLVSDPRNGGRATGRAPLSPAGVGDLTEILFDRTGVLIAGEPGAGKTTTLLRLHQDLLERAAKDDDMPIPVMFHLGFWSGAHRRLDEWLADRLTGEYGVPDEDARAWVVHMRILPLLDGLDEVAPEHRAACVRAVNTFHAEHGLLPLVISSRLIDYQTLTARLEVPAALCLQPLSRPRVDDYLKRLGRPPIQAGPEIEQLLRTPFLLSVAARTHDDTRAGTPDGRSATRVAAGHGSLDERREQLVAEFVRRALLHLSGGEPDAAGRRVLRTMAYLARTLALRMGNTFHIESISVSWLPLGQRGLVAAAAALPAAALAATAGFVLAAPVFSTGPAALIAALLAITCGIGTLTADNDLHPPAAGHPVRVPLDMIGHSLLSSAVCGLFGGICGFLVGLVRVGVMYGWDPYQSQPTVVGHDGGAGAFTGLLMGLSLAILRPEVTKRRDLAELEPAGGLAAEAQLSIRLATIVGVAGVPLLGWAHGIPGLLGGVLLALTVSYLGSGRRLVTHWCTRVLLARQALVPRQPLPFLESAVSSKVLMRVGGGYAFAHSLLLEYFARLELTDLSPGYRLGGLPVTHLRPETVLDTTLELAGTGNGNRALIALRYARFYLKPQEFAPAALRIAEVLEPAATFGSFSPADVEQFIAAHQLVIDTGDPNLAPGSAFRVATFLATAGNANPHVEQEWRNAARRYFEATAASAHPHYAPQATHHLTTDKFQVPQPRFLAWAEKLRQEESDRNAVYPM